MTQEIKNQILTIISNSIDDINAFNNDKFKVNNANDNIINISVNLIEETLTIWTLKDDNTYIDNELYYRFEDDIENYNENDY